MHKFKADLEKQRFYMMLEGFYTEEKLKEATDEALAEADKLMPGYTVINDIARLRVTSDDTAKHLGRMRDYAIEKKIKLVIRIVGNTLSKMQLSEIASNESYRIVEVRSLDEAEKYLEEHGL